MLFRPPALLKMIYPSFIWRFPSDGESFFLTFDDGPTPDVTPWVLDRLDEYGAKATFFCLGKNVDMYPDIYREILDRGHAVGNHTYSHQKGWNMGATDYVVDVDTAADLIDSNMFRPPYFRITRLQERMLSEKYHNVMWSILARDYNRSLTPRECAMNVIPHIGSGEIAVMHDSVKCFGRVESALPWVLDEVYKKNLKCKSIIL